MEYIVNAAVRNIEFSGIRRFANLVANYPGAISLTLGQPDFPTPDHIKQAAIRAIEENRTTYTQNQGLLELRQAACAFIAEKYGQVFDAATEVIVTNGVSQAIDITLRTILEPGVDVLLPGPVYPGYIPVIRMCGSNPIIIDTRHDQFRLTADAVIAHWTPNTRCLILPYPSNPTGVTMPAHELELLAKFLADKQVYVISDEIYSELVYDGQHQSIAVLPGMRDKTIVINGLSKSHAMTGWRIGFTFAPSPLTEQMLKVHQFSMTCTSSISQNAAIEALTYGKDDADIMRKTYRHRRDTVVSALRQMGLDVATPSAAFYAFPDIAKFRLSSFDFASRMLDEVGVAVVPGNAFGIYGEGYLRLSFATSEANIAEGLERMATFVHRLT